MTIHITPEPEFSYVSFESNIPLTSYLGVIQRVLETFMPGKFILTIFANRVSKQTEHDWSFVKSLKINNLLQNCVFFRHQWLLSPTKNYKNVVILETGWGRISNTVNFRITNWPMLTLLDFPLERGGHLGQALGGILKLKLVKYHVVKLKNQIIIHYLFWPYASSLSYLIASLSLKFPPFKTNIFGNINKLKENYLNLSVFGVDL